MSDREKEILENIAEGLPQLSEFEKGYVLGMVETRAAKKEEEKKEESE